MQDITGKNGKAYFITISNQNFEEVGDFNENDDIEVTFKGRVAKVTMPMQPEGEVDYNEHPEKLKDEKTYVIEIKEGDVLNKKPERQKAEELGISVERYKKIKSR